MKFSKVFVIAKLSTVGGRRGNRRTALARPTVLSHTSATKHLRPKVTHGLNADPTFSAALTPLTDRVQEPAAVPPLPAQRPLAQQSQCANCHAPLAGHFCGQCGAPRLEERPLTVHRFIG